MAVTVACSHCGKTYKVDPKMTGKKVRCKGCGQVFVASLLEPETGPGAGVDIYAGLADAANMEQRASGASALADMAGEMAPAPRARVAQPMAPAAPVGAPPMAPQGVRTLAGDPPCPSCHAPLPITNRVCMNCGFDRRTGKKAQAIVEREQQAVQRAAAQRSRLVDSERPKLRPSTSSEFPPIAMLQDLLPTLCVIGLAIVFIWGLIDQFRDINAKFEWLDTKLAAGAAFREGMSYPSKTGAYFKAIGIWALGVCIVSFAFAGISVMGVYLTSKILKFEMPDAPMFRMNGVIGAAVVPIKLVTFLISLGAASQVELGVPRAAGPGLVAALLLLFLMGVLSFFTTWAFFRLRFVEALLSYVFMVVFGGLFLVVIVVILFLIGMAAFAGMR